MTATQTRYPGDGVREREQLLDYLASTFGSRWFLRHEVTHPLWVFSRVSTLRAHGLLVSRPLGVNDPRRFGPTRAVGSEFRVVGHIITADHEVHS